MIDSIVKVTEAAAHLINSFAWPVVALIALQWLMPIVRLLLSDKSDVSLTGWGWAITAKRESREAIALAESSKDVEDLQPRLQAKLTDSFGKSYAATKWLDRLRIAETVGKTVLWVDDRPNNNNYERRALESLGISVEFVPSTDQALAMLKTHKYDVVISDMSRPEGERAGYDLLAKIRLLHRGVPFILYSSSNTPEQEAEIKIAGAFGSTSRASELIRLVTDAIKDPETNNRLDSSYWQAMRNFLAHKSEI